MTQENQPLPVVDLMIADALLRLRALETMLIRANIFTAEAYNEELKLLAEQITQTMLQKANIVEINNKLQGEIK